MNEKRECKIVQDLLPNYIEKLTSIQTNQYIEEHVSNCNECKKMLENMQKEISTDTKVNSKKEVKYIKKFRNRMRTLSLILLAIFLVFTIVTVRKAIIMADLSQKAEKNLNSMNYHKVTYSHDKGNSSKVEEFVLNNKKKVMVTKINEQKILKSQMFIEKQENEIENYNLYTEIDNKKIAKLNQKQDLRGVVEPHNDLYTEGWLQRFLFSIPASVKSTTFNGKTCYYVSNFSGAYTYCPEGMYVDKNTGIVVNSIAYEVKYTDGTKGRWPASENEYEFGTVTEKDFIEPDISEYEIEE